MSIAEIAEKTGIPENTVRRYASKFKDFLPSKATGRTKKYSSEITQVILRISQLYQDGKGTVEVQECLQREVPQVIELKDDSMLVPSTTQLYEMLLANRQQFSEAVKMMTAQQQEIGDLRGIILEQQKEMMELQQQLQERSDKQTAEIQDFENNWIEFAKQVKERDRQLRSQLNELNDQMAAAAQQADDWKPKRPWWKWW